jgi:ribulose-5-phosphate 4-epimerase/fuculose-1-phosphate aldolase
MALSIKKKSKAKAAKPAAKRKSVQKAARTSVRAQVSATEWEVRVNLAAAYRLMDLYEMTDHISNHISVRVPAAHNEFLINPYGLLYNQMTASCMIRIDLDGNELFNPNEGYEHNQSGYVIHSAIHAARPDVDCVIHAHTLSGMAVSAMQCGLLPQVQMSMRWAHGVSYHDYESIVDVDERAQLVRELGNNDVMILRNHGLLTCGRTIAECFYNMFWLKRSCDLQVMLMSCNTALIKPSEAVIEKTWKAYEPGGRRHAQQKRGLLEWPSLLAELDRIDPSFRD